MPKSRKRKSKRPTAPSSRILKMNLRLKEILELQMERFRKKFGRDPGPGDPVFFDPDADVPSRMPDITDEVLAAMQNADLPPEFAYAYRKTGLLGLGADKSGIPTTSRSGTLLSMSIARLRKRRSNQAAPGQVNGTSKFLSCSHRRSSRRT
jgi:hypothetical protein